MKILLFTQAHYSDIIELVKHLSKRVEIILVVPEDISYEFNLRSKVYKIPIEGYSKIRNIFALRKLSMIIEKESPDLINFNHYGNPYLWFIKLFFYKTKLVNTVHDVNPNHGDGNLFHKIWFSVSNKLSDAIIVLCNYNRRLLEKHKVSTKIYTSKLGPINSYNADRNFKLSKENNALFFGRIRRYKGLKYLLNAIPSIKSKIPDFKLTVAGSGGEVEKWSEYQANKDNINLINRYINDDEIYDLFVQSKVTVLPYIEASQSGPLMLSLSFGRPVVATTVGSLPEYVSISKSGILVSPKSTKSLAKAIVRLFNNRDLFQRLSKNSREALNGKLGYSEITQTYVKIFRNILSND